MKWFFNRLNEATGKAGVMGILTSIAGGVSGQMDTGSAVALGLTALAAFVAKETGSPDHPQNQPQ